jgi:hypothetical protein
MSPAVRQAFEAIDSGCVDWMIAEGRYVEDVWA